jgi:hypothetical protein
MPRLPETMAGHLNDDAQVVVVLRLVAAANWRLVPAYPEELAIPD